MVGLLEQAYVPREIDPVEEARDEVPFNLLDTLAVESDSADAADAGTHARYERGWDSWTRTRPRRLAGTVRLTSRARAARAPSAPRLSV